MLIMTGEVSEEIFNVIGVLHVTKAVTVKRIYLKHSFFRAKKRRSRNTLRDQLPSRNVQEVFGEESRSVSCAWSKAR